MIDSFKNDKFDFDPGTKMAYNNSGYFLLGAIIEKVSGKSFNDYLRDTFFEPLGMHDTGVHTSTAVLKHEAPVMAMRAESPPRRSTGTCPVPARRALFTRPWRT